jgi:hypothetical protein
VKEVRVSAVPPELDPTINELINLFMLRCQ